VWPRGSRGERREGKPRRGVGTELRDGGTWEDKNEMSLQRGQAEVSEKSEIKICVKKTKKIGASISVDFVEPKRRCKENWKTAVGLEVLAAVVMNAAIFWDTKPCSPMWTDVSEERVTSIFRVENQ
jgi:hypothetical protein